MCRIKQFIVMSMVVVFLMGCAGQQVKNTTLAEAPDGAGAGENTTEERGCESPPCGSFYERNRHIIKHVFIATLVVAEIALFWYLADEYHDSHDSYLWIGPLWPVWY